MTTQDETGSSTDVVDPGRRYPIRPVGTWVVAAFLVLSIVTIWTLVSFVFQARS